MSAIAGIYNSYNEEPVAIEHINGMMKDLEKFPTDDIQLWQKGPVFLGCHAQWITPESTGEQLPFYDSERKCAITADCIIDNREELFEALQVPREDQKTIPDSLLILLAYYKWGEDCPKFLIGDYAFMIWDEKAQKFFGARDPSGYRTLYYYKDNNHFVFCTTIEPILTLPYISKKLNENWLAEYLAITGMIDTIEAKQTPYMNIKQLQPFHSLTLSNNNFKFKKYGSFYSGKRLELKSSNEYVEAFQEVFTKSVKSRIRTIHLVGSQLSGGLDSSSVVGYAANLLKGQNKKLHTLSYKPPEDFVDYTSKRYMPDESPFIKKTVNFIGGISDHYYDFKDRSSYTEIEPYLEIMEMPYKFFENSFWLRGIFEEASKKGIGILLNGDKGNSTISWGSAIDYYAVLLKRLKWYQLVRELHLYSQKVGGARLRLIPVLSRNAFPVFNKQQKDQLSNNHAVFINQTFAKKMDVYSKLRAFGMDHSGWIATPDVYKQRKLTFENMYPWNSGNTLITKLSLRYKMWKRDPTNDLRVVRFCLSLPEDQYVQGGMDRALIRRSTKDVIPDQIRLNQRVKGIQGADWIHRMLPHWANFVDEVKEMSEDQAFLEYVDNSTIKNALIKSEKGPIYQNITDPNYRILMRSLIVYRFLNTF